MANTTVTKCASVCMSKYLHAAMRASENLLNNFAKLEAKTRINWLENEKGKLKAGDEKKQ